ncbi:MAG: hypothetical protein J6W00_06605 [Lentisphaeria bacterium]|nr:hypothetical protein [Lentisphaeria bacterium]
MQARVKKLLTVTLLVVTLSYWGHSFIPEKGDPSHWEDFRNIFNGYGDDAFFELSKKISSGIDATQKFDVYDSLEGKWVTKKGLPALFNEKIGSLHENHRILGRGWGLNDKILKETLEFLCKDYPGKEHEVIKIWNGFVNDINKEAVRLTGLPQKQANAFASLLYDIHLLGDIEPNNTRIDLVLDEKRIVKNIENNVDIIFKNKPEYAKLIKKRLQKVLRSGGERQQLAQALMTELYNLRIDDMLKMTWGKTLKTQYSIDRAIAANASRAARPISKIHGIRRVGKKAADFVKRPGVKFVRGILQEHTINGKLVTTLSVPISPALKAGGSAGVMTLIFTEGVTVYKFANGTITEEEFIRESAKNCGGALTVGTTTFVLVALGATPTGWVVIGAGIAAELVYEVAFDYVYKEFATPLITMDDLIGKLPTSLQRRRGAFNHDGFESFLEANQERLSLL